MGWLIDPVSSNTVLWGGDPLFITMRASNPSQILGQATDYSSMFHMQYMNMKSFGARLDPEKQSVVTCFKADPKNKITLQGCLKDVSIWSLCQHSLVFLQHT